jgi:hypothetical protein
MRPRPTATALCCVAIAALAAPTARAGVLYTFDVTDLTNANPVPPTYPALAVDVALVNPTPGGTLTLDLAQRQGAAGLVLSGDLSNLAFLDLLGVSLTPDSRLFTSGGLKLSLGFDASGAVDATSIQFVVADPGVAVSLIGTGGPNAHGQFGTNDPRCGTPPGSPDSGGYCGVSGTWTRELTPSPLPVSEPDSVPEPATIALIGAGVIGLGIARRSRAAF